MRRLWIAGAAVAVMSGALCPSGRAQNRFEIVTGKAFDSAVPKDFYLEGNAIPTEKRNAVLVKTPAGTRALFALIDTTGYAASVQSKYVGMIITEGDLTVCGHKIGVGSYGFGWELPGTGVDQPGKFSLYNQAGAPLADCTAPRQGALKMPRPLQLVVAKDGAARLYHGKHYIALQ
ncbi:MAG TPA: hypothetical protein VMI94_00845 [Bryobacteraceae bacterium]|nr:hypothetical protein [Bryobacteraceae bacterium]